ncbi:MAG TPA: carboxypeptidase-like regulatory domain-containing protein, partial [Arachidicoccus sp.]|nr:carboxypeptidase-like regulatory domain-containing protein [Arachidicoccus sp.]
MKPKILFCLVALFCLINGQANAQSDVQIKGTVLAGSSLTPLEGVVVTLKGTSNQVLTDSSGTFRMEIPTTNGTLVLTYIGLQTKEVAI